MEHTSTVGFPRESKISRATTFFTLADPVAENWVVSLVLTEDIVNEEDVRITGYFAGAKAEPVRLIVKKVTDIKIRKCENSKYNSLKVYFFPQSIFYRRSVKLNNLHKNYGA